jgi:hypothetical protein
MVTVENESGSNIVLKPVACELPTYEYCVLSGCQPRSMSRKDSAFVASASQLKYRGFRGPAGNWTAFWVDAGAWLGARRIGFVGGWTTAAGRA